MTALWVNRGLVDKSELVVMPDSIADFFGRVEVMAMFQPLYSNASLIDDSGQFK